MTREEGERIARDVAGIIVIGTVDPQEIHRVFADQPHLVFVDHLPGMMLGDAVRSSWAHATENALDYLISLGCQHIASLGGERHLIHLEGGEAQREHDERERAFVYHTKECGVYDAALDFKVNEWNAEDGYRVIDAFFKNHRGTMDGLIAANDRLAIGAMRAIQENGMKIPDDVRVIGFNDLESLSFLRPSLTSVHLFAEALGETAVRLLNERLLNPREYPVSVMLPTRLIVRESTGGEDSPLYTRVLI